MKNKKGFLLAEETLKIILAVIAIGFLIYFLTVLYFSKVNDRKLFEAETLLKLSEESIEAKINNLEVVNPVESHLVNPQGWYFFGFIGEKKPNSCVGKNCICICDDAFEWFGLDDDAQFEKCDEEGVCLIVEGLKSANEIEMDSQWIVIEKKEGFISIMEK